MENIIKSYKLKELAELEGKHPLTIKNSKMYLKIQIETTSTKAQYKAGITKSPYGYRYVKVKDIQEILKGKIDFTYITK